MDESPEGVEWVQDEFDALWHSTDAVWLADAVIEDIGRLAKRIIIPTIEDWARTEPDPAAPIVELPVFRRENGLWAHQKSFVKLAFDAHRAGGAWYVLADQVGLGKTVQLGLTARLMALVGSKPILILAPKPLLQQWQGELWSLLQLPVAVWNGRQRIDENGIACPDEGLDPIEAWDLLDVLTRGADAVMSDVFSEWRRKPVEAMDCVLGKEAPPTAEVEIWERLRNPLPPGSEGIDFRIENVDWETCSHVLDAALQLERLRTGWSLAGATRA